MQNEIQQILDQLQDVFDGDPWFGRPVACILREVKEEIVFEKPAGQHSILELVWHMGIWRRFTISRLQPTGETLHYFEENDWTNLDHSDKGLWQQALQQLYQTQTELLRLLKSLNDSVLEQTVPERAYNYRKLLNGIIQHDIYHLGQIAYLHKLLSQ